MIQLHEQLQKTITKRARRDVIEYLRDVNALFEGFINKYNTTKEEALKLLSWYNDFERAAGQTSEEDAISGKILDNAISKQIEAVTNKIF